MNRIALLGMALVFAATLVTAPAVGHAEESPERNDASSDNPGLEEVERQIDAAASRLEALEAAIVEGQAQRATLEAALVEADERVGEREQRIAGLADDISAFDRQLDAVDTTLAEAVADIGERHAQLAEALQAMQRTQASTGLRVLLRHEDPALVDRLGVYSTYLIAAQNEAIAAQTRQLARLETAQARALKDRNWLQYIQRKAGTQRDEHLASRAMGTEQLSAVDSDLQAKRRSVAELRADRDRLQALMEEIEALQSSASGYFAAGKGHYALPVDGTILAEFGDTKSVGKLHWNGLLLAAPEGSPVRTIADGEVVYAERLSGFGLLVIIDHGDNFMTLYGHNRTLTRTVGEWVESGSTIATSGHETAGEFDGQSTGGLYFEIRENAKPVDPKAWLVAEKDPLVRALNGES